jgi:hypothetical protein
VREQFLCGMQLVAPLRRTEYCPRSYNQQVQESIALRKPSTMQMFSNFSKPVQ